MPENRAAGNEKLPVNFGEGCVAAGEFPGGTDFSLASPCGLRNNFPHENQDFPVSGGAWIVVHQRLHFPQRMIETSRAHRTGLPPA
jgi:hypothetical protein